MCSNIAKDLHATALSQTLIVHCVNRSVRRPCSITSNVSAWPTTIRVPFGPPPFCPIHCSARHAASNVRSPDPRGRATMRGCTGVAFSAALCRDLPGRAVEVLNSWASSWLFVISRSRVQLPPPAPVNPPITKAPSEATPSRRSASRLLAPCLLPGGPGSSYRFLADPCPQCWLSGSSTKWTSLPVAGLTIRSR